MGIKELALLNRISIMIVVILTAFQSASARPGVSISPEAFGKLPSTMNVQISPDGSKLLLLRNIHGKMVLVTRQLEGDTTEKFIPYDDGLYNWAVWASNDRIIASVRFVGHEDRSADLNVKMQRRLLSIAWDGSEIINPNKFIKRARSQQLFTTRQPQIQDQIIDILKDDPDHVLVQMDVDRLGEPAVYKLNILTGKRSRVLMGRRKVDFWMSDDNHVIRYREGVHIRKGYSAVRHIASYRKCEGCSWLTLYRYDELKDDRPFYFEGFSENPDIIYITADDENGVRSLYTYDVNQQMKVEKIAGNGIDDIVDVSIGEDRKLEYYSYYPDKPKIIRLGERGEKLDKVFAELFPGLIVDIVSETRDKQKLIIKVAAPVFPSSFYYLDLKTGSLEKIASANEAVDLEQLSDKIPVSYEARDGLTIPAYLSLPKNGGAEKLPTIILPHGGPMARDSWDYEYWTQFLTTRGYAVFQMNYRGSTGYGEKYRKLGYHEWGRKMLYDINDGTKYLIEQGIADPDRICIMGGSYGGYAALQSVVMDEHDYKCAIAFAPVTHLAKLMSKHRDMEGFQAYKHYVESEDWTFEEASPALQVDNINIPVFIMHGTNDLQVPTSQSSLFFNNMDRAGKEITYIELEGGDHFLSFEGHRVRFLKEIEYFLSSHLY